MASLGDGFIKVPNLTHVVVIEFGCDCSAQLLEEYPSEK